MGKDNQLKNVMSFDHKDLTKLPTTIPQDMVWITPQPTEPNRIQTDLAMKQETKPVA